MGYQPLLLEVCAVLEQHEGRLTFSELAAALGEPIDEIRRQVQAYTDLDSPETLDLTVGRRDLLITPADTEADDPSPSDDDAVELIVPTENILGVEQFDAAILGPLYQATEQLLAEEPNNETLADAAEVLRTQFLPGVRQPRHYRGRYVAALRQAIDEQRKVAIVYSRAWRPGVTSRVIEPYALNTSTRGTEVDAGPLDQEGRIRTFLISRIREVDVLPDTFERPPDAVALVAEARATTPVTGYVAHRSRWAVEHWSEKTEVGESDEHGLTFTAHVLPPLGWRCGLMRITAGPDLDFDDPRLDDEAADLAGRLLTHHGLDDAAP
jgi:proteasome accessory factor C